MQVSRARAIALGETYRAEVAVKTTMNTGSTNDINTGSTNDINTGTIIITTGIIITITHGGNISTTTFGSRRLSLGLLTGWRHTKLTYTRRRVRLQTNCTASHRPAFKILLRRATQFPNASVRA